MARMVFPYQAGLTYLGKQFLVQAGVNNQRKTDFRYPLSRTEYGDLKLSPWSFTSEWATSSTLTVVWVQRTEPEWSRVVWQSRKPQIVLIPGM